MQSIVARDVELLQVEAELGLKLPQRNERLVAEVTVRRGVDSESRQRDEREGKGGGWVA